MYLDKLVGSDDVAFQHLCDLGGHQQEAVLTNPKRGGRGRSEAEGGAVFNTTCN